MPKSREAKDALQILDSGLESAHPKNYLKKIIFDNKIIGDKIYELKKYDKVFVISVGKSALEMAETVESLISTNGGLIIVPKIKKTKLQKKFTIIKADHPLPTRKSVFAAKMIIKFLKGIKSSDFVIFLISGGSSALVSMPDGITISEKKSTTKALLRCGASIQEVNCVRKHLSGIKGGKLMSYLKSDGISLLMSDVVGDDLSTIASGITYFDKSTFADAMKVIKKYDLQKVFPKNSMNHIKLGFEGKIQETPKKPMIENCIIANNKNCLNSMVIRAKKLGYSVKVIGNVSGDVGLVARKIAKMFSNKKMSCIVFGGETTVKIKGKGKGGRNQELVLLTSLQLHDARKTATIASIGTDGIDGSTNSAGAIYNTKKNLSDSKKYLANNNSYGFFKKYGGHIITGSTGTNLLDIGLILKRD